MSLLPVTLFGYLLGHINMEQLAALLFSREWLANNILKKVSSSKYFPSEIYWTSKDPKNIKYNLPQPGYALQI